MGKNSICRAGVIDCSQHRWCWKKFDASVGTCGQVKKGKESPTSFFNEDFSEIEDLEGDIEESFMWQNTPRKDVMNY